MENTRKDKLMNRTDKLELEMINYLKEYTMDIHGNIPNINVVQLNPTGISFKIPVAWFFNLTFIFTLPLGDENNDGGLSNVPKTGTIVSGGVIGLFTAGIGGFALKMRNFNSKKKNK